MVRFGQSFSRFPLSNGPKLKKNIFGYIFLIFDPKKWDYLTKLMDTLPRTSLLDVQMKYMFFNLRASKFQIADRISVPWTEINLVARSIPAFWEISCNSVSDRGTVRAQSSSAKLDHSEKLNSRGIYAASFEYCISLLLLPRRSPIFKVTFQIQFLPAIKSASHHSLGE